VTFVKNREHTSAELNFIIGKYWGKYCSGPSKLLKKKHRPIQYYCNILQYIEMAILFCVPLDGIEIGWNPTKKIKEIG
jgi:hypothetical protein